MDLFNDTNDFIAENTRSYSVKFLSTVFNFPNKKLVVLQLILLKQKL